MKIRLTLVAVELVGFIVGLTALLEWLNLPPSMPFWPTLGWVFTFLGMAVATAAIVLVTLLWRAEP